MGRWRTGRQRKKRRKGRERGERAGGRGGREGRTEGKGESHMKARQGSPGHLAGTFQGSAMTLGCDITRW